MINLQTAANWTMEKTGINWKIIFHFNIQTEAVWNSSIFSSKTRLLLMFMDLVISFFLKHFETSFWIKNFWGFFANYFALYYFGSFSEGGIISMSKPESPVDVSEEMLFDFRCEDVFLNYSCVKHEPIRINFLYKFISKVR